MTNKLLYSVRETFSDFLDGKTFHIPPYQRGYKWKPKDVRRLLDDIDSFSPDNELGTFYCVQNITLVESAEDKNVYNVVDGQQRLTTTTVILSLSRGVRPHQGQALVRRETRNGLIHPPLSLPAKHARRLQFVGRVSGAK